MGFFGSKKVNEDLLERLKREKEELKRKSRELEARIEYLLDCLKNKDPDSYDLERRKLLEAELEVLFQL